MNLEEVSIKLKGIVSTYETKWFLGDMSSLISMVGKGSFDQIKKLKSPFRQLSYLAGLNLTSDASDDKQAYSNEDWDKIVLLLNKIDDLYLETILKLEGEVDEEFIKNREITIPAFLSYYNEGYLNYEEQTIEKISNYFDNNKDFIEGQTGLKVHDFIEIYNLIDYLKDEQFTATFAPDKGGKEWKKFIESQSIEDFATGKIRENLPERAKKLFEFMADKGTTRRFSTANLHKKYDSNKIDKFLAIFSIERAPADFLYYTSDNPLAIKPIYEYDKGEFQLFTSEHLLNAIYLYLESLVKSEGGSQLDTHLKKRGKSFEEKVVSIFRDFFGDGIKVFKSYYTDLGNEQDVLIIYKSYIFIIEAKASRRVYPMRDPDKSIIHLERNFKEVIQKGYDQTYRIKEPFIDNKKINIYRDETLKDKIFIINSRKYRNAFSIIPTLQRYSNLQTDLELLLKFTDDKDSFPWSVCIDDLEIILLYLKSQSKNPISKFIEYLEKREIIHGGVDASDEIDIFSNFFLEKIDYDSLEDGVIFMPSKEYSHIFDDLYRTGFGFKNEKNIDKKNDPRIMII